MQRLLRDKTKNIVSIPLRYYFVPIILSLIVVIVSSGFSIENILVNLGYGIIASTIVSFLVDYAATKRQREKDHINYKIMMMSLEMSIKKLIIIRYMINDDYGQSYRSLPYSSWINEMRAGEFQDTPLRGEQVFKTYLSACKDILREARNLNYFIGILINNQFAEKNIVISLKELVFCFEEYVDKKKYDYAHTLDIMEAICSLFPKYSEVLLNDWSNSKAKPFVE